MLPGRSPAWPGLPSLANLHGPCKHPSEPTIMSRHNHQRRQERRNNAKNNPAVPNPVTPGRPGPGVTWSVPLGDPSRISISSAVAPEPPPYPEGDTVPPGSTTGRASRANAVKGSLRSKLLFTEDMLDEIARLYQEFAVSLAPVGALEEYLCREAARSSAQDSKCHDQLLLDDLRCVERVGTSWDLDLALHAEKTAATISDAPEVIAGTLGRCKHGAIHLIKHWNLMRDIVIATGSIDEPQRQVCYDLLGLNHVYRTGCVHVPARDDRVGLLALADREIARHRANLEQTLLGADSAAKGMAMLGIVGARDNATRLLRADQNRARRRFSWALNTLDMLRQGADPATLIDPDTGKPVTPGARPTAVKPRTRTAPVAAPPAPADPDPEPDQPGPESAAPSEAMPVLPEGLPDDVRDMLLVAAGTIVAARATQPAAAAGPPAAA